MSRIPLPEQGGAALQRGIEHGTGMFSQLLGHGIQRAGQQQQWQQHLHNLALKQQQEARLAELHPYQRANLEAQARYHEAQANDLLFNQNLLNQYMNGGFNENPMGKPEQSGMNAVSEMGNLTQNPINGENYVRETYPELAAHILGGGKPIANNSTNNAQNVHPVVAAKIKKLTGWDPNEMSPEQKQAQELDTFAKKKELENKIKGEEDLTKITPATRTKYQDVVREVNSIMPVMNELVEKGGEKFTSFKTANDLKYLGKVKRIADVYMKAKGWPNTNDARNDAIDLFKRGKTESPEEYKSRMQELQAELIHERDLSAAALKSGKSELASTESSTSSEKIYNPATRSWE